MTIAFYFTPELHLRDGRIIRDLDDAASFAREQESRPGVDQRDEVLHKIGRAQTEETAHAANGSYAIDTVFNLPLGDRVAWRVSASYDEQSGFINANRAVLFNASRQPVLADPNNPLTSAYATESLEHAVEIDVAVAEMCRVVKPGGRIAIIDKNAEHFGKLKTPEWEVFTDPDSAEKGRDFQLRVVSPPKRYAKYFEKIVLAERLREVRALVGFTRIESPSDYDNPAAFPENQREGEPHYISRLTVSLPWYGYLSRRWTPLSRSPQRQCS